MLPQPEGEPKFKAIQTLEARISAFATMRAEWSPPGSSLARSTPISRKDIDPDALKVLNRLRQFDHVAYLVGGSVRDLLLGRRPKDFDIGTSAHPYEVKRLFRNCWIIGRRFRLAHVKFGTKAIEVATFRRQVTEAELDRCSVTPAARSDAPVEGRRRRRDGRRWQGRIRPVASTVGESRSPDPPRQHVRHARRGRLPPRLHRQRPLLRYRDVLDHRLRRGHRRSARTRHPVHRRS